MTRYAEVELDGVLYTLNFSVAAFISLADRFGGNPQAIIRAIRPEESSTANAILEPSVMRNTLDMAAVLIEHGSKYRRLCDGVECPTMSADELGCLSLPNYIKLYTAVISALTASNTRQIEAESDLKNAGATQGN